MPLATGSYAAQASTAAVCSPPSARDVIVGPVSGGLARMVPSSCSFHFSTTLSFADGP